MNDQPRHIGRNTGRRDVVATDLVEYFIVAVPGVESLGALTPGLAELVEQASIRILDLVVLAKDLDGSVTALEPDAVPGLQVIDRGGSELLSERDIEFAAMALQPGTAGVVIVSEDRWAEPISIAAGRAGGRIVGGERIPAARVEAALVERSTDELERG